MRRLLAAACLPALAASSALATQPAEVLETYADIAEAAYGDSLASARTLQSAVEAFLVAPSPEGLTRAREAWLAARVPYQQTEVYRFGNPIVDDWEGRVNAWPLDEGLIDYVSAEGTAPAEGYDGNPAAGLNVIANRAFTLSGAEIDATEITPALLQDTLHEAGGAEANVATGYHAIEFLLWGQDIGPYDATAGERPWTDYATGTDCTNDNCDRRGAYLQAATDLLVTDLEEMAIAWGEGGAARQDALEGETGLQRILTGMGSLSYGEQAGERMQLGLLLNDPEEEHSCFSDNTHWDHFYDALGIRNVYLGRYVGIDGTVTSGPSLHELLSESDPAVAEALKAALDATQMEMTEMVVAAEAGLHYDMMLNPANEAGGALIQAAIDGLVAQTREIERAVAALDLSAIAFEGSDSLDDPNAVFE
ncbi:imelysin family protein [Wenxinia saemankumensis]|uniref:Imelysin. Metallo peptidase. MEROPS family M75 n=1 Tax=Wenxinia saemankumensis TaxID=1447782 RepID=A0A1M6B5R5_9RHOB|nr:imelysin family protein [Wenxinia saemankumensis]SHI43997.1 imelysin. Metallo peptidase. MEROPS family M75 [Wenxinia saemankumensis]